MGGWCERYEEITCSSKYIQRWGLSARLRGARFHRMWGAPGLAHLREFGLIGASSGAIRLDRSGCLPCFARADEEDASRFSSLHIAIIRPEFRIVRKVKVQIVSLKI